jgi:hypothetical protein
LPWLIRFNRKNGLSVVVGAGAEIGLLLAVSAGWQQQQQQTLVVFVGCLWTLWVNALQTIRFGLTKDE